MEEKVGSSPKKKTVSRKREEETACRKQL